MKPDPKLNLVQIQERYIRAVANARQRWAHSKTGGHADRVQRGARRKAERALARWGFTADQARKIVDDARDTLKLEDFAE